jgi:hypothetical protein
VDERWISVEVEDDGLVLCEERVEVTIREAVRMLCIRLETVQIHDVHESDLQIR